MVKLNPYSAISSVRLSIKSTQAQLRYWLLTIAVTTQAIDLNFEIIVYV